MQHPLFWIAVPLLVAASSPGLADAPVPAAQASPACDRSSAWPKVFDALKQSRIRTMPSERLDVSLPDLASTGAMSVPDGGPQRLRVRRIKPEEGAQVWLYPGRDRLRGLATRRSRRTPTPARSCSTPACQGTSRTEPRKGPS